MATVKPKTTVTMRLEGACASHSRTDVKVRDVKTVIDEPADRGGTNQGLTPTETLMASLIACTNVITHKVAEKNGVDIDSMSVRLEAQFDRPRAPLPPHAHGDRGPAAGRHSRLPGREQVQYRRRGGRVVRRGPRLG